MKKCVCGQLFQASGRRKYCSDACKQKAYRNRLRRYDTPVGRPKRPLLRYHGGKFRLAQWIVDHFPDHSIYVEPFAGAASVFFTKSPSPVEVLNDKNARLVNLFKVIADPTSLKKLIALIRQTPYSRAVYYEARLRSPDPVIDAARMLVLGYQSHCATAAAGGKKSGWRRSLRSQDSHSAKEWKEFPTILPHLGQRTRGIFIEQDDALSVIRNWDKPQTLFYIDPPYLLMSRSIPQGYEHEMLESDHLALAEALTTLKGRAILSGYDTLLYRDLYRDWTPIMKHTFGDKAKRTKEVLWLSPNTEPLCQSTP